MLLRFLNFSNKQTLLIDIFILFFIFSLLHGRLLDYFDPEGFFILTAGEHFLKYGILATPEYQFIGDTDPSSPYYVSYFFAGLGVLLFGHTSLGAVAYVKLFTFLTILAVYWIGWKILGRRVWGWLAAAFLLWFPFSRDFITTRGDMVAVFFGWTGVALLLYIVQEIKQKEIPPNSPKLIRLTLLAGVSVALAFFAHPLGFQFYLGACLLLLVNFFGPIGAFKRQTTWLFLGGFSLIGAYFSLFVINWEKYLYFASQFQNYTTQFLPLSKAINEFPDRLQNISKPFFFMRASDPLLSRYVFGGIIGIGFLSLLARKKDPWDFAVHRYFLLIFFQFVFIYIYAVPAYRQYLVHALPLLAMLIPLSLKGLFEWVDRLFRLAPQFYRGLVVALIIILVIPSFQNIQERRTLWHSLKNTTLIQDAVSDLQSVIPPGSRVATTHSELFLFPEQIVRTVHSFQQFKQLPIPDYIIEEQKADGLLDYNYAWYTEARLKNELNTRLHFMRFLPNYFVISSVPGVSFYHTNNCSRLVGKFKYKADSWPDLFQTPHDEIGMRVYKTNYNEWPFKRYAPGTILLPSFSDPITAIRYRKLLHQGKEQKIVIPEPELISKAHAVSQIPISIEKTDTEVELDGSASVALKGEIVEYRWENMSYQQIAKGKKTKTRLPPGDHTILLRVINSQGLCSLDTVKIKIFHKTQNMYNFALKTNGGSASARATHFQLSPNNAIDGKIDGGFNESWISETSSTAWWQVDLGGKPQKFDYILVHFRDDYLVDDQTNHIVIRASNDPEFNQYETLASRGDDKYPHSGLWKIPITTETPYRYLRVVKNKNSYTSIVEFQVFGVAE
jgi:hypothetical protein